MAKSEEEELEELVDDLEDLELDEDAVVATDEDPDAAPKKKRRARKPKTTEGKQRKVIEGVTTKDVADAAGISTRELRMFLRAGGFQPKDEREGRYVWKSMNDPEVKAILKKIKAGAVEKMNKEKITELKGRRKRKASAEA